MINYSKKQLEIMDFIYSFTKTNRFAPKLQEIADHLNITPVTAHEHVTLLEKKCAIKRERMEQRSIEIIDPEYINTKEKEVVTFDYVKNVTFKPGEPSTAGTVIFNFNDQLSNELGIPFNMAMKCPADKYEMLLKKLGLSKFYRS